jgi:hypothetical protein
MKKIAMILFALAYTTRLFAQASDPIPTDQGKTEIEPAQKLMFWERLELTDMKKIAMILFGLECTTRLFAQASDPSPHRSRQNRD